MATSIGSVFRSFWHTMTSYDRHSNYDSPYRSGRHVPLNGAGTLTSVATASESRTDLPNYQDDYGHPSTSRFDSSYGGAGASPMSPGNRPYSPGMRSLSAARTNTQDGFEVQSPAGEIPMQSFQDGMPPVPSVVSSWSKIDRWAEEHYRELYDQLCEGCTVNDLNELEHQLDCSLPQDVRESLQVHDGQERGGTPTGIIFGSMLLDCEEMVQEWENWRKVNHEFLLDTAIVKPSAPTKALGGSNSGSSQASSSKAAPGPSTTSSQNPAWRQDLLARQDCVPQGSVQRAYAHPAWIPLVRDWGGNNLAVDLAPGPKGRWGQIILFGRDYDTKYVVARSWGAFLALVADDLKSGRWFVDEETGELKLREFKGTRVEPGYFDILRWRMDQKYGRTAANKRKSLAPGARSPTVPGSPYASPTTEVNGEARGRSMQRLSPNSPVASPIRPGYGKSSPLARVQEEVPTSLSLSLTIPNGGVKPKEKLVEVDTPRPSGEEGKENISSAPRLAALVNGEASPAETEPDVARANGVVNGKQPLVVEDNMKTIEI
ncbi:glucan synthesis regulatory protein [Bombardia bombarda]|uniref:Glucan synthesis regulatory protein n=1 Tax=Bombardia bombarda TaxID=252184 RepID=A0AA39XMB8_9PEZI|nr:glucan synthesis regulatory protein [Bombardia bombarda]